MILTFAAVAEEFFFRGFLLPACVRKLESQNTAVLMVSSVFAFSHFWNLLSGGELGFVLLQVLLAFVVGVVLCKTYLHWGLLPCAGLHALVNLGPVPLYIDPGTGSMLFTILIGLLGVFRYLFHSWFVKAKFMFSGGGKTVHTNRVPLVIFADDKRYWQIFEPICRELANRKFPVRYLTMSQDDTALKVTYAGFMSEFIGSDNRAFAKLNFLNAVIVLSTTPGLDVFQWKRSPEVDYYIHVPHASTDITLYHMFGIDYYDALLLSGEYQVQQVRALEQLRNLPPKDLQLVGLPYMDEMKVQSVRKEECFSDYNLVSGTDNHNCSLSTNHYSLNKMPCVLLAPSWGKSGILSKFGTKIIDALLATGYHLIIRPHPQSYTSEKDLMDRLQQQYPVSHQLEWNRDRDNFDVLSRADILISDFSGVIFDYALVFDKPVIYTDTEFDKGPYDAWWLEEEPWVFRILPSLGQKLDANNLSNVKEVIDTCLSDNKYAAGRNLARQETWVYQGEGARRVADYIQELYSKMRAEGGSMDKKGVEK